MSLSIGNQLNGGKKGFLSAFQLLAPVSSKRQNSSDVKFLSKIDPTALRRGRGGRSSFSGIVATVFGATGFTGRYVVNKLGKTGTQIILPYRCQQYDVRHLKVAADLGQILFMPFHISDENAIRKAMKHSSVVINLIGREFETKNFNFEQANIESAHRIAKCAKEMGVERLIHVSTLNGLEEHEGYLIPGGSKYLQTKGASEEAVRSEFPEAIIFRPSDIWGQEDRFLTYYASYHRHTARMIALPKAGVGIWKQPVCVSDFAEGIVKAMVNPDAPGTTYEIVGPRRYELGEIVDYMHKVMRRFDHYGYKRYDMMFDPLFKLKIKLQQELPSHPLGYVTYDKIERESVTDVVNGLPSLEDLGVNLTVLEDVIAWELRPHRAYAYYDPQPGEFPDPEPPKYIAA